MKAEEIKKILNKYAYGIYLTKGRMSELIQDLESLLQQNKGGQEAHRIIKNEWDKSKATTRDGDRMDFHQGYDYAMKSILKILHKRFIP